MTKIIIRKPTTEDAFEIARDIRPADGFEINASSGRSPIDVILDGVRDSTICGVGCIRNKPIYIFGVQECTGTALSSGVAYGWLLTTTAVDDHKLAFWRSCKEWLPILLGRWAGLTNYIDNRHTKAIEWAERLGFRLDPPKPWGLYQMPFRRFEVTMEDLNV